jgi:hypothetical protein
MPGKMCHDVSGDKKSIGNWQMETAVSRDGLGTFWYQSGTDKMGGDAMLVGRWPDDDGISRHATARASRLRTEINLACARHYDICI